MPETPLIRLGVGLAGTVAALAVLAGCGVASEEEAEPPPSATAEVSSREAIAYRSPTCGCCENYEEYLTRHGFAVESEVTDDLDPVKERYGIPPDAESCHTVIVGNYVVEGHVPVEAIQKLLDEQPDVDGIALPGMPSNSPGMGEPNGQPLEVISVTDGETAPFVTL